MDIIANTSIINQESINQWNPIYDPSTESKPEVCTALASISSSYTQNYPLQTMSFVFIFQNKYIEDTVPMGESMHEMLQITSYTTKQRLFDLT